MLQFLLRATVVAGLGAIVAGCDLFKESNTSQPRTNIPDSQQNKDFCRFFRNSIGEVTIEYPVAEFGAFTRNQFTKTLADYLPTTTGGDFSVLNEQMAGLFHDLSSAGLRFYIGDNLRIDSQNEVERLRTVFNYYSRINASRVDTSPNANPAYNNLVRGWKNDSIKITFHDVFTSLPASSAINPDNIIKTILTSVNIYAMVTQFPELTRCGVNPRVPDSVRDIMPHFDDR